MRQTSSVTKDPENRGGSGMMRGLVYAILLSLVVWIGAVQVALIFR